MRGRTSGKEFKGVQAESEDGRSYPRGTIETQMELIPEVEALRAELQIRHGEFLQAEINLILFVYRNGSRRKHAGIY